MQAGVLSLSCEDGRKKDDVAKKVSEENAKVERRREKGQARFRTRRAHRVGSVDMIDVTDQVSHAAHQQRLKDEAAEAPTSSTRKPSSASAQARAPRKRRQAKKTRQSQFGKTLTHWANSDRIAGIIMLCFAAAGLLIANLPVIGPAFEHLREFVINVPFTNIRLDIADWVQDGVLTLFFLVVGLELKQELTHGSLSNPKRAAVPMIAAVGGMVAPPIVYLSVVSLMKAAGNATALNPQALSGWAVPTATDIAFSLAVLAIFSKGLPSEIRGFLLTLATVDDLLGILLIAFLFTSVNQWYWFVLMGACALLWAWMSRLKKVPWPLVALLGIVMWSMTFEAGIHPTLSGVIFGLLVPSKRMHGERTTRAHRWATRLNPISALFAVPLFALFATAIPFGGMSWSVLISPIVLGIVLALVIGKPLGVMVASWISVHLFNLELAGGLKIRDMIGMACACGIGFTVSFLIASLAFSHPILVEESRLAVLLGSVLSAVVAAVVLTIQSRHPKQRWQQ